MRRHPPSGTGKAAAHGEARRTCPGDELTDRLNQARYLRFGLARGLADVPICICRQRRFGRGEPLARARLDDHHADAMRRDVMQFSRDPGPFIANSLSGKALSLRRLFER